MPNPQVSNSDADAASGSDPGSASARRFIVVVNQAAGAFRQMKSEAVRGEMSRRFSQAGIAAEIVLAEPDELERHLDEAVAAKPDALIVAGGDGTVGGAALRCAKAGLPLGIIPLGTFNLLARDLGIPLTWPEAIDALTDAPVRPMDIMRVNDRLCLCMAVLGFYPALMRRQSSYHGWWPVRLVKNLIAAWRMALAYPQLEISITAEDTNAAHRTRFAVFANNGYEEMFGLIPKRRSLAAGMFTLYVSRHATRFGMVRAALGWVLGRWSKDREIVEIEGRRMTLKARRRRSLSLVIDGEAVTVNLPLKVVLEPGALHVLAPDPAGQTAAAP